MDKDCIIVTNKMVAKYFLSKELCFPNLLKMKYQLFKNYNILIDCCFDEKYGGLLKNKQFNNKRIVEVDRGYYKAQFHNQNRIVLGFCDITNWLKKADVIERAEGEFILKDFLKLYGIVRINGIDIVREEELMMALKNL